MADDTARTIARDWWREHIDTADEVDIKELSKRAALELATDTVFCATFTAEFLPSTMYEMGQRMVAARRSVLQTREGLREQLERDNTLEVESKWSRWLQYDPDRGVHIPIVNMTMEQVLASADYLGSQKQSIAFEEKWLRLIAKRLQPGQHVGDVLTDDDLESLRTSIKPTQLRKVA
ncbi:MAG: hypothetical protein M3440_06135 [Chloroflexota bacterium]|nr:hypothetical protein [Chloroflexota bacterium]